MPGPEDTDADPETDAATVEEAAARATEQTEVERPVGDARPERTGPDGEPLGGEGS